MELVTIPVNTDGWNELAFNAAAVNMPTNDTANMVYDPENGVINMNWVTTTNDIVPPDVSEQVNAEAIRVALANGYTDVRLIVCVHQPSTHPDRWFKTKLRPSSLTPSYLVVVQSDRNQYVMSYTSNRAAFYQAARNAIIDHMATYPRRFNTISIYGELENCKTREAREEYLKKHPLNIKFLADIDASVLSKYGLRNITAIEL